ncbi:MAG: hypothetical protein EBY39_12255, partial [Flavobacteriia bacterium]|nr:hypothetical protein [Flavobacteriia bacterium]
MTGNNFDDGLFVSGNPVLTGNNFDDGLFVSGNPVLTGNNFDDGLKVGDAFDLSEDGSLFNISPNPGDAIKWDGSKWVPGFVSSTNFTGNNSGSGYAVPAPFVTNLASGKSVQAISFAQTFAYAPGIATDLETNGEGAIIPYTVSGVSATGYYVVFTAPIPNNNYKIHTVFGGGGSSSSYWQTG